MNGAWESIGSTSLGRSAIARENDWDQLEMETPPDLVWKQHDVWIKCIIARPVVGFAVIGRRYNTRVHTLHLRPLVAHCVTKTGSASTFSNIHKYSKTTWKRSETVINEIPSFGSSHLITSKAVSADLLRHFSRCFEPWNSIRAEAIAQFMFSFADTRILMVLK